MDELLPLNQKTPDKILEPQQLLNALEQLTNRQTLPEYQPGIHAAIATGLPNIAESLLELCHLKVIDPLDLAQSNNPIGFYELHRRRGQIKAALIREGPEVAQSKALRILGVGELSPLKRPNIIFKGMLVAAGTRLLCGNEICGIIFYGSAVNDKKPDTSEIDVEVITQSHSLLDAELSSKTIPTISHTLTRLCRLLLGKQADVHYLSSLDLEEASTNPDYRQRLLSRNKQIDNKSVSFFFDQRSERTFKTAFATSLKVPQTEFGS